MTRAPDAAAFPPDAGLCATCAHARLVRSSRGSVFVRCALSREDARFPRYPPLPVVRCAGHRPLEGGRGPEGPSAEAGPR